MENLNLVVAKNLIKFRKSQHLTQAEFADKINYSDKSVSKWEKGEAIPSLEILVKICEIYSLPIEYFTTDNNQEIPFGNKKRKINKIVVTLLSIVAVWLVALFSFLFLQIALNINLWILFVWALPVMFVVTTVFACLWSMKHRYLYISISLLVWTLVIAVYVQFLAYNLWLLYIIGGVIQIGVILWAFLKK